MGCTLRDMGFLEPGCNVYMKNMIDILVLKKSIFRVCPLQDKCSDTMGSHDFFQYIDLCPCKIEIRAQNCIRSVLDFISQAWQLSSNKQVLLCVIGIAGFVMAKWPCS